MSRVCDLVNTVVAVKEVVDADITEEEEEGEVGLLTKAVPQITTNNIRGSNALLQEIWPHQISVKV